MATHTLPAPLRLLGRFNPLAIGRNLWSHRDLTWQFIQREVEGRYRGSFLGIFWSLARPLFLLGVYTYLFGVIFKSRWPEQRSDALGEFALILFAGLITFELFSECVVRAPTTIVSIPNYVKKVVFPLEIMPLVNLGAALFHFAVGLAVLLVGWLLTGGGLQWTVVFLPLVLLPLVLLTLGVSWVLASLGVYLRDVGQLIGLLVQALFFFTPIFYTIDSVPEPMRSLMGFNPLAPVITHMRDILLFGRLPDFGALALSTLVGALVAIGGYVWFAVTRRGFADVL